MVCYKKCAADAGGQAAAQFQCVLLGDRDPAHAAAWRRAAGYEGEAEIRRSGASVRPVAAFYGRGGGWSFSRSVGRIQGVCGCVEWGIILVCMTARISENKDVLGLEKQGLLRYDFSENAGLLY